MGDPVQANLLEQGLLHSDVGGARWELTRLWLELLATTLAHPTKSNLPRLEGDTVLSGQRSSALTLKRGVPRRRAEEEQLSDPSRDNY
jgi:hypothetical protein